MVPDGRAPAHHDHLVRVEDHGRWAELVLNRPNKRNALTPSMVAEAREALADLQNTVGVILLRGAGGTFCSGLDLDVFKGGVPEEFSQSWAAFHRELFACRAVLVGAHERHAINGGAALALACDLLVTGTTARLVVGEAAQGAPAPMNLAWLAIRSSEAVALKLALTARPVDGIELERLGLACDVVPDEDVVASASALAERLASLPTGALLTVKRVARQLNGRGEELFALAQQAQGGATWEPREVRDGERG
jgi:enoyl-CoA hydratase/carnithine racemase